MENSTTSSACIHCGDYQCGCDDMTTEERREERTQKLEEEGCTRSDAQGIVEAEDAGMYLPTFSSIAKKVKENISGHSEIKACDLPF